MSWSLIGKPTTIKVTKALAKAFAEMEPAPHDRPLSERRLQVYSRIFEQGGFRPVTWAKATCTETGGIYRVNGKHTSVLLSGMSTLPDFYVTVEEYSCETLEDVARLYATFDSKTMSRTTSDINLSFAATVPELRELSGRTINLAVAGMAFHKWQGRLSSTQAAERAEYLLEHTEFVIWLQDILADAANSDRTRATTRQASRHLQRQPVAAAMFGCYSKTISSATTFWIAVRDETGASPNLPDRKLARYLLTHGVDKGGGIRRTRHSDSREMYVKSLHAWNAWRKGETTNLNYYPEAELPAIK